MIRFDSDYTEGCIPEILTALTNTNDEQTIGYGKDNHCVNAANLIKQTIKREDAIFTSWLVAHKPISPLSHLS